MDPNKASQPKEECSWKIAKLSSLVHMWVLGSGGGWLSFYYYKQFLVHQLESPTRVCSSGRDASMKWRIQEKGILAVTHNKAVPESWLALSPQPLI